jgi:Rieske Fe-S protein
VCKSSRCAENREAGNSRTYDAAANGKLSNSANGTDDSTSDGTITGESTAKSHLNDAQASDSGDVTTYNNATGDAQTHTMAISGALNSTAPGAVCMICGHILCTPAWNAYLCKYWFVGRSQVRICEQTRGHVWGLGMLPTAQAQQPQLQAEP